MRTNSRNKPRNNPRTRFTHPDFFSLKDTPISVPHGEDYALSDMDADSIIATLDDPNVNEKRTSELAADVIELLEGTSPYGNMVAKEVIENYADAWETLVSNINVAAKHEEENITNYETTSGDGLDNVAEAFGLHDTAVISDDILNAVLERSEPQNTFRLQDRYYSVGQLHVDVDTIEEYKEKFEPLLNAFGEAAVQDVLEDSFTDPVFARGEIYCSASWDGTGSIQPEDLAQHLKELHYTKTDPRKNKLAEATDPAEKERILARIKESPHAFIPDAIAYYYSTKERAFRMCDLGDDESVAAAVQMAFGYESDEYLSDIEISVPIEGTISIDIDWEKVYTGLDAKTLRTGIRTEETNAESLARAQFKFDENWHLVDLVRPEEIRMEGAALGHCVGKPNMGYIAAVLNKKIKIYSLRNGAGRSKFTIEVALKDGKPYAVSQVKGKANRLPTTSFEVAVCAKAIRALGLDPALVLDMQPGLKAHPIRENPHSRRTGVAAMGARTSFDKPYQKYRGPSMVKTRLTASR